MTAYANRPEAFERLTGRAFEREVHRLARRYTAHMAAQLLGYTGQKQMHADLQRLGIAVDFQPKSTLYTLGGHPRTAR